MLIAAGSSRNARMVDECKILGMFVPGIHRHKPFRATSDPSDALPRNYVQEMDR